MTAGASVSRWTETTVSGDETVRSIHEATTFPGETARFIQKTVSFMAETQSFAAVSHGFADETRRRGDGAGGIGCSDPRCGA